MHPKIYPNVVFIKSLFRFWSIFGQILVRFWSDFDLFLFSFALSFSVLLRFHSVFAKFYSAFTNFLIRFCVSAWELVLASIEFIIDACIIQILSHKSDIFGLAATQKNWEEILLRKITGQLLMCANLN